MKPKRGRSELTVGKSVEEVGSLECCSETIFVVLNCQKPGGCLEGPRRMNSFQFEVRLEVYLVPFPFPHKCCLYEQQ